MHQSRRHNSKPHAHPCMPLHRNHPQTKPKVSGQSLLKGAFSASAEHYNLG
jgi:hypothetical protein